MATKTVYSLIIDRSGSMADIRDEIFQSVNRRIEKIIQIDQENSGETLAEITTFNHGVHRIISLRRAAELDFLQDYDYQIDGTTALFDALGSTLERLNLLYRDEVEKGETDILVIVYTDGFENASRNYSKTVVRDMVKEANAMKNFEVTLVGCDEITLWMAREMAFDLHKVVRVSKDSMARSMDSLDSFMEDYKKGFKPNFKTHYRDFNLDKDS